MRYPTGRDPLWSLCSCISKFENCCFYDRVLRVIQYSRWMLYSFGLLREIDGGIPWVRELKEPHTKTTRTIVTFILHAVSHEFPIFSYSVSTSLQIKWSIIFLRFFFFDEKYFF